MFQRIATANRHAKSFVLVGGHPNFGDAHMLRGMQFQSKEWLL